jgi:hypothetical protein
MNTLTDKFVAKVEAIASRSSRLMSLADAVLDKILPQANAAAGSCTQACTFCPPWDPFAGKIIGTQWCAYCNGYPGHGVGCNQCQGRWVPFGCA